MCTHPKMELDIKYPIHERHRLISGSYDVSVTDIPCTCKGEKQPAAYILRPIVDDKKKCIIWNNCARTLYTSFKRQIMAVPLPERECVDDFIKFAKRIIDTEVDLTEFDYSFSQWYNHLSYRQQRELEGVVPENKPPVYNMFCKREVQCYDVGDSLPKTRAISGPEPQDKYVLGPVTWALEDVFEKQLHGYGGSCNWQELEAKLHDYYSQGFTVLLQGDCSGFDRTQAHEVKEVDRYYYNKIANKVYHVDKEIFLTKACARYRKINGKVFSKGKATKIISAVIDGGVNSGNPDTTLSNTIRMALYTRFFCYKAKVEAKVLCKGDDFVIFLRSYDDAYAVEKQIHRYWSPKDTNHNENYGLGAMVKFVKIGDYTTFDFCSTHLLCDFITNTFKIVRQWQRIIDQSHYSMKALSYSQKQKNAYVYNNCVAMSKWDKDMPFYKNFRDELMMDYNGDRDDNYLLGKQKKIIPHDGHKLRGNVIVNDIGYHEAYINHTRVSDNAIPKENIESIMLEKYNVITYDCPWKH